MNQSEACEVSVFAGKLACRREGIPDEYVSGSDLSLGHGMYDIIALIFL